MTALVELADISTTFPGRRDALGRRGDGTVALDRVDLAVQEGETLGLVGESGSGKTTLARLTVALATPTRGSVSVLGTDPARARADELRALRRRIGFVFQDPVQSFNPRRTVQRSLELPLENVGIPARERRERVAAMMERVGLRPSQMTRYPHEFSGGQAQRLGIARAMINEPEFVALDEPVSALDVSIQAQILNLLRDLQEERRVTYLLVGNSLAVVEHAATHVAVMYRGRIVEYGTREQIYAEPAHPYTRSLLAAGRGRTIHQQLAESGAARPQQLPGCPFAGRCPLERPLCAEVRPEPVMLGPGRLVLCHAYADRSVCQPTPTEVTT